MRPVTPDLRPINRRTRTDCFTQGVTRKELSESIYQVRVPDPAFSSFDWPRRTFLLDFTYLILVATLVAL